MVEKPISAYCEKFATQRERFNFERTGFWLARPPRTL